mmetsp:Transcript_5719/g.18424  ORF Transcript_5719/g.18424 Transcript_5719/m.18424 type:complete len:119 (+) Transcript_5719:3-359(+)
MLPLGAKRPRDLELVSSTSKRHANGGVNILALAPVDSTVVAGSCPICRSLLIQKCIGCSSRPASGSPCTLSFGVCGCVYHHHCLGEWHRRSFTCPLHEVQWQERAPCHCPALVGDGDG